MTALARPEACPAGHPLGVSRGTRPNRVGNASVGTSGTRRTGGTRPIQKVLSEVHTIRGCKARTVSSLRLNPSPKVGGAKKLKTVVA
jgi:hypothetical protein